MKPANLLKNVSGEGKRVFKDFAILMGFIFLEMMFVLAIIEGKNDYDKFILFKDDTVQYEKSITGKTTPAADEKETTPDVFFVIFVPPPLYFLCSNDFSTVYATVTLEDESIVQRMRSIFEIFNYDHIYFFQVIYFGFAIIMLFAGLVTFRYELFPTRPFSDWFGNIIIRMLLLDISFIILMVFVYYFLISLGVQLSPHDVKSLLYFFFYLLVFLNFFYAAGIALDLSFKKQTHAALAAGIFWAVLFIFIPGISDLAITSKSYADRDRGTIDEDNIQEIVQESPDEYTKRKDIMASIERGKYAIAKAREYRHDYEGYYAFTPTLFLSQMNNNLSGDTYQERLDFLEFSLFMKEVLLDNSEREEKESYMNIDDRSRSAAYRKAWDFKEIDKLFYLFNAKSRKPRLYYAGVAITFSYTVILLLVGYTLMVRKRKANITFTRVAYKGKFLNVYKNKKIILGFTEKGFTLDELAEFLGVGDLLELKQTHSNFIHFSGDIKRGMTGDGIILDRPGSVAVIKTADCVPLFFWDKKCSLGGIVHIGWRGLHKDIEVKLIEMLKKRLGSREMKKLIFFMGPAIAVECYEVSRDMLFKFTGKSTARVFGFNEAGSFVMNIKNGIINSLVEMGIARDQVQSSGLCTHCEKERFPSYRRDKKNDDRIYNFLYLIPPASAPQAAPGKADTPAK